jgi:hypothetical protein
MKKKIGIAVLALIIIIQFFRIDQVNPEVVVENDFIVITKPDAKTVELLKSSCYDCHSNTTEYPWYANVAPVSWWIKDHINEAKSHLNFSEWTSYSEKKQLHKLHECYEEVEHGEMPLDSYTWTHSEAKLSHEDREHLEHWFEAFGPFEDAD